MKMRRGYKIVRSFGRVKSSIETTMFAVRYSGWTVPICGSLTVWRTYRGALSALGEIACEGTFELYACEYIPSRDGRGAAALRLIGKRRGPKHS